MLEVTVTKSDLPEFLRSLAKDRRLVASVKDRMGTTFAEVDDPSLVCVGLGNTNLSPKGVIFPQSEVLLTFAGDEGQAPPIPDEEVLLFGVRPCDARAFSLLDKVFTWEGIEDPYYLHRRERTTVVALACNEPGAVCFCTSVGGSPAGEAGADVLAFDLGEKWLLRALTERGEALLNATSKLTQKATDAETKAAEKAATEAKERLKPVSVPESLEDLKGSFELEIWEELALGCLGCGACTYSCPTCHCFDITDESRKGVGRRVRSWDTCAFPLFTLHGSGHNPRPEQHARLRQRILHKFLYCPENFGEAFCVGCGRCVTHCPAGLDLRGVLERLASLTGRVKGVV